MKTRTGSTEAPEVPIDGGMRQWYEHCSCCLSETYPNVKRALDQEATARGEAAPVAGEICRDAGD